MSSPGDDAARRSDDRDLDAAIDALARRVERAIAANRRERAAAELEPLALSPLDHVRSVLSPPGGGDADATSRAGQDADPLPRTDRDADPSATRDDNP